MDYRDAKIARRQESFARKKQAEAWGAQTTVGVHRGIHVAERDSVSVRLAGEHWLERAREDGLEASTLRQYDTHLRLHIVPAIGDQLLSKLTVASVMDFQRDLAGKRLSTSMARKVLTSLGSIISEAQRAGWAAVNPVRDLPRRRGKAADRHTDQLRRGRDIPTPDEIKAILAAADARGGLARAIVTTAVFKGLRISELRGLRWESVDLDQRTLEVCERADDDAVLGSPKTDAGRRTLPLTPKAVNALREWKVACPKGPLGLVFPNGRGRVENRANLTNRVLGPVLVSAGVIDEDGRSKYGWHAFRHFYASWLLGERAYGGQEMLPKRVQTLLGHSTIQVTMDTYGHLLPAREDEAEAFAAA